MTAKTIRLLSGLALVGTTAVVIGAGALGAWYGRPDSECPVPIGQPFPDMSFATASGTPVSVATLGGRNAVLLFTAPGCPACAIETPAWTELMRGRQDAAFWQITVGSAVPEAAPASRTRVEYLADHQSGFSRTLHARRVPMVVLLDADRIVRGCTVGVQPGAGRTRSLQDLLGRRAAP